MFDHLLVVCTASDPEAGTATLQDANPPSLSPIILAISNAQGHLLESGAGYTLALVRETKP